MKKLFGSALEAVKNVDTNQLANQARAFIAENTEAKFVARETPSITLATVREGKSPSVLVINGFLSQRGEDVSDWLSVVDELYPKNNVIHVQWSAGNLTEMALGDGIVAGGVGGDKGVGKLLAAAKLARGVTPAGIAMIAGGVVGDKFVGHWKKSFNETLHVGNDLAKAIQGDESLQGCILMGHSLGARVIRHTLNNLDANKVSASYLLAGAVSAEAEQWADILEKHTEHRLVNCYGDNDYILKGGYRAGTLFNHTPVGLTEIGNNNTKQVMNLDVSEFASGHTSYKNEKVGKALAGILNQLTFGKKSELSLRY
ncbi:DUF726 domain-containing protein [Moritella sp. Urea-trap-13]|uniref:DUF726 domain-containing protein n=1 Tax=Moritella sp. Urea-trap-13 TaxID=2058327 RepID=UPI000C31FFD7|nr:DUF726 domain-containing protein [Moritella sp. Urea-trap-13]PKH07120.1 DUF726 domain-containing protein [Moritella sp. Urea-trap-13]